MIKIQNGEYDIFEINSFEIDKDIITMYGVFAKRTTPFILSTEFGNFAAKNIFGGSEHIIGFDIIEMSLSTAIKDIPLLKNMIDFQNLLSEEDDENVQIY